MGKKWDSKIEAEKWGRAMMPLLYPGALVFMFGGTRTWHKLATGMDEAGFELLDTLMWLYGTGFPKGQKVEDWDGYKTPALKPAWEPILMFRVPRQGKTYAQLAQEYGSGCLNVDGGRIPIVDGVDDSQLRTMNRSQREDVDGWGMNSDGSDAPQVVSSQGRYPANLIVDEESAGMLDEQSGVSKSSGGSGKHSMGAMGKHGKYSKYALDRLGANAGGLGDSGGASRFFYCAKASRRERGGGNNHPTVKPISLTKWLATLLLPPDSVKPRRLLVPFAGSGSEMIGAVEAGWDEVVGIENNKDYCEIAEARLNRFSTKSLYT